MPLLLSGVNQLVTMYVVVITFDDDCNILQWTILQHRYTVNSCILYQVFTTKQTFAGYLFICIACIVFWSLVVSFH